MNPFQIGQSLFVQFGTRQAFTVTALRTGSPDTPAACATRFPNSTFVKWYSMADLLRWNPQTAPKSIVPVQFPAIVPGLRVTRAECLKWQGTCIVPAEDYTVVCVLHGVAYVRHHRPELAGSITDKPLRTFWLTSHPSPTQTRYEAVTVQGHELRTIAAIHRARCKGQDYWMNRLNAGLDALTPRLWERLNIEFEYRKTRRLLDAAERRAS